MTYYVRESYSYPDRLKPTIHTEPEALDLMDMDHDEDEIVDEHWSEFSSYQEAVDYCRELKRWIESGGGI